MKPQISASSPSIEFLPIPIQAPFLFSRLPISRNKRIGIDSSRLFETPRVVSKTWPVVSTPSFTWADYVHSQLFMLLIN
ncbi:hypothetical protein F383_17864 [Gossypium arboreum]|uniref:Uncharacterized protein n=1 Tax=Gossypium arboreum TaxID=29729 RepID=A0A0B0NLH9_GOSAR|nr:hypothetical protein F383_17864 [Gossypium arboreum]